MSRAGKHPLPMVTANLKGDLNILRQGKRGGLPGTLLSFLRLSGPGWLQSALTLGGGSLASSLYLGVLGGYSLLWLQPVAMVFGIVMLSAIGYVTMSTGKRPFQAVNEQINPVLGWGWALASLVASMVWCLPQYSLATAVLQQNLLPGLLGPEGPLGDLAGKLLIAVSILAVTILVTWSYGTGGRGVKVYESMLKIVVGMIVVCFAGVLVKLALSPRGLDWAGILRGFIPNPASLFTPSETFQRLLAEIPVVHQQFWTDLIVSQQRDVLISAAATAVGINMTFLFPYTILSRGWGKEFRGLAVFDLATGMLIPFMLATSCVVIASAAAFHGVPEAGVITHTGGHTATPKMAAEFDRLIESRRHHDPAPIAPAEEHLAATLLKRDARNLARSLAPLTGNLFSQVIFGIGVLGMTLSTISLLMLVSGFIVCEMLGLPATGWPYRLGTLAAATGVLGPFIWSKAAFYLAVPVSVFGMVLLPIAYLTFLWMMNSRSLLGKELPRGGRRIIWNVLMGLAAGVATVASVSVIWIKAGWMGIYGLLLFLTLALAAHVLRHPGKRLLTR